MLPGNLSNRELDIMQALWRLERPASVSAVHDALAELQIDLAYTTIQTMLNRMEQKRHVVRTQEGRAHLYAPATAQPAAARSAILAMAKRFFGGSPVDAATALIGMSERIEPDELARLEAVVAKARGDRG